MNICMLVYKKLIVKFVGETGFVWDWRRFSVRKDKSEADCLVIT